MNAYSYLRFSTPEQAQGDSYRRQIEAARQYAESRGLTLDESFRDEGVSGFSGDNRKRGALAAFVRAVEDEIVPRGSVLIVESLDRLSREQVLTALRQFLALIDEGIEIVTLSGGTPKVFSAETLGRDALPLPLIDAILTMARAHEESATKSMRVRAAFKRIRDEARATGAAIPGRMLPGWIRREGDRYVLDKPRAEVVRSIFKRTINGAGMNKIAADLTTEGVPTFRPRGEDRGWHPQVVRDIVSNVAAYGAAQIYRAAGKTMVPEGDPIPNFFPAAVSRATWNQAQHARAQRAGTGGRNAAACPNLFAGLARCSCGSPMFIVSKGPKQDRALACDGRKRGKRCNNPRPSYNLPDAERAILPNISSSVVWLDMSMRQGIELSAHLTDQRRQQLSEAEATMRALATAFREDAPAAIVDRIRELAQQAEQMRQEIAAADRSMAAARRASKAPRRIPTDPPAAPADRHAVRAAIRAVVTEIKFDGDHAGITVRDPDGTVMFGRVPLPPRRRQGITRSRQPPAMAAE